MVSSAAMSLLNYFHILNRNKKRRGLTQTFQVESHFFMKPSSMVHVFCAMTLERVRCREEDRTSVQDSLAIQLSTIA